MGLSCFGSFGDAVTHYSRCAGVSKNIHSNRCYYRWAPFFFFLPQIPSPDTIKAALSFLPVLLYTVSLWIFVNEELVQTLPKRFQRVASYIFLLFIPLIIALNEIASFIGIKHGTLPFPSPYPLR